MSVSDVLYSVQKKSEAAVYSDDDYTKNGLLHCGKCNTPKQHRLMLLGKETVVPIVCECMAQEIRKEEKFREQVEKTKIIEAIRKNGIPDARFKVATFDNDDGKIHNITEKLKRYCDKFDKMQAENIGLLFWGSVGTGKSYMAACIANRLIDEGKRVMMTSFSKMVNEINSLGFDGDKNRYIYNLSRYDLLIIDDLGAERQSDYMLEQVYTIIDERSKSLQPIIVTTNLPLEELKNPKDIKYQRIYDRILEITVPIRFIGESRRKNIGAEKLEEAKKMLEGE